MDAQNRERRSRRLFHAVIAGVAACATASVSAPDTVMAQTTVTESNSADRLIVWTNCSQVARLSDAQLDLWKSRGVDGFVCMHGRLSGMGGPQDFTGDPQASLASGNYDVQRHLRDTNIVGRMRARGMKAYLGLKLSNYNNTTTPLADWFDDRGWSELVLPRMADAAAAARSLGFAGLAFDQELYPQQGGRTSATWKWNYRGNTRSEAEVRAQARQRGRELMSALTGSFPGLDLMAYHVYLPDTWTDVVWKEVRGREDGVGPLLDIDFWDGLSSVEGYGAIRLVDATFYKAPRLGTWETAFQYHFNKLYSYLSRRLSNWDYASSRLFVSPFSWIDAGPSASDEFDDARPPEYVAGQLAAFRRWGMGGEFANYAYGGLAGFDYGRYTSAMQAASTPGVVDASPPVLSVNPVQANSGTPIASLSLDGTATDDLAIRFVRWQNGPVTSGTAQMSWEVLSGDYNSRYDWRTRWSAPAIPLRPGENRIAITVEDIKGLATTQAFTFANGSGSVPSSVSLRKDPPTRLLRIGKVTHRARYTLARARRGIRIKVARVGTGLKARLNKRGRVRVRHRGGWYVLKLKLPRRGAYKLKLTPTGGPSRSKTIVIRVV